MKAANDPAAESVSAGPSSSSPGAVPEAPITSAPPADAPPIPLPPVPAVPKAPLILPERMSPERLRTEMARLDRVLAVVALLLAFFLGSFLARNTDLWMHLASGRLTAQGQNSFGVDPFAYTTGGQYWVNHSWLFDLVAYASCTALGGPEAVVGGGFLVLVKALLLTALAWILLQMRRPVSELWLPAIGVVLSMLTLSPRATLQPAVLSFLFLGLTLLLLHNGAQLEARWPWLRRPWTFLVLFALWVNVDSWFFLGPLTVGLFLLGRFLQQKLAPIHAGDDAPEPGETRTLAIALVGGIAACLLNPHHVHALRFPTELTSASLIRTLSRDSGFKLFFLSPLQQEYFLHPGLGKNPAGLAYVFLVLLGLVSFGLNCVPARTRSHVAAWQGWRGMIWLAFLILSLYHARFIPFFAVVAGPIMVLNLQDFVARCLGPGLPESDPARGWALGGRALTLVAGVLLLLAAWPGWVSVFPGNPQLARRVAWGVEVDPSLKQTALKLRELHQEWQRQGLHAEATRGFSPMPEVAHYCAWFCPEEKGFFDLRLSLFRNVVEPYVELRAALNPEPTGSPESESKTPFDWPAAFRQHGINHVVLTGSEPGRTIVPVASFLRSPRQWALLSMDGRTTVFGWKGAYPEGDPFRKQRFDSEQLAYQKQSSLIGQPDPGRTLRPPDWWDRYLRGSPRRPLEADEAQMDLLYFNLMAEQRQNEHLQNWLMSHCSGMLTLPAREGCSLMALSAVLVRIRELTLFRPGADLPTLFRVYLTGHDIPPPGAPILAIRAARRGILATPDHPSSYLEFAKGIEAVWLPQENRWARSTLPPPLRPGEFLLRLQQRDQARPAYLSAWVTRNASPRQFLRQVQVITAFQDALRVDPGQDTPHAGLAHHYRQMTYYDLALEHQQRQLKLIEAAGPRPGFSREQHIRQVAELTIPLQEMEEQVERLRNEFALSAARLKPVERALVAFGNFGLPGQALAILMDMPQANLGPEGAELLLYLLLTTGRLDDLRAALQPEFKPLLKINYDWYHALLAGCQGDYVQAGKYLDEVLENLERSTVESVIRLSRDQAFGGGRVDGAIQVWHGVVNLLRNRADFHVVRGLLALEAGDTPTAADHFRRALDVGQTQDRSAVAVAQLAGGSALHAAALLGSADIHRVRPPAPAERAKTGAALEFESRPVARRYLELIQAASRKDEG